jgi:hypothetical protein
VLVRCNPEVDRDLDRHQTRKPALLSVWLHARQRRFLFELLVPPTPAQLERCGGRGQYDRDLRAGLVVQALRELQQGDVEPDIWKIEGLETAADCLRIVEQARTGGSVPVPILSTAISERFASRGGAEFADRVMSAMRFDFGGHEEKYP